MNPLLSQEGEFLELRYEFLTSYFEVILVLSGICKHSLEIEFIKTLANLGFDSLKMKSIRRFFSQRQDVLVNSSEYLITALHKKIDTLQDWDEKNHKRYQKAIGALLWLCAQVAGGTTSASRMTEIVLKLYGQAEDQVSTRQLKGLYIYGDFPAMDFSNLIVIDSIFDSYKNFLRCKFNEETRFISSRFNRCFDDFKKKRRP